MTTLAIDHLGLAFAGWLFFAVVLAVVLGRILGLNDRLARQQREELAERLETQHPVTSISEYIARCEDRDKRARFRHAVRHSRRVG